VESERHHPEATEIVSFVGGLAPMEALRFNGEICNEEKPCCHLDIWNDLNYSSSDLPGGDDND
jgi:hypothetical protein